MLFDGRDANQPVHPNLSMVAQRVARFAKVEINPNNSDVTDSPHYVAVVAPALEKLNQLKHTGKDQRSEQSGDAEARSLLERHNVAIA